MTVPLLRKLWVGLFVAAFVLSLSGCSLGMDVETLLRPPQPTGEQQEIQTALEAFINGAQNDDEHGAIGSYVLKYPKSGEFRSAFIVKDLDGDGEDEAIAFYRRGSENSNVHVNLLRKINSNWKSVSDIEGVSTDIERIRFGDLDGDGILEIIAGWNITNVSDRQLVLYSLTGFKLSEWYKTLYTGVVIADLTACGHDNLLVLYANATENVTTAQLWTTQKDEATKEIALMELGITRLDGYIQQFGSAQIGKLSDTLVGVFVDGLKKPGMVTELIYWDGTQLRSPFYDTLKNSTSLTYRDSTIPCKDVDGDGMVEWPITSSFSSYSPSDEPNTLWKTEWKSWDNNTKEVKDKFSCIMNMTDGYYLRLDNTWKDMVTASYDKHSHVLRVFTVEDGGPGNELLALRTVYALEASRSTTDTTTTSSIQHSDDSFYTELENLTDVRYEVRYSTQEPFSLNMDRIRYMFTHFTM